MDSRHLVELPAAERSGPRQQVGAGDHAVEGGADFVAHAGEKP